MNINEMKEKKRELGYSNEHIAELSGVPLGTVQKIFSGETRSPRYSTLQKLEKVFRLQAASSVRESSFAYGSSAEELDWFEQKLGKRQGQFTIYDRSRLPDDIRTELIDGTLYLMTAPTKAHQLAAGLLHSTLMNFRVSHDLPCMPFFSPVDVQLDEDDRTMVQPDIIVQCSHDDDPRVFHGAPDLVIEILSPSTRKKDLIIKLNKYMAAGVKELWFVDLEKRQIIVYDFANNEFPLHYSADEKVPVALSDGDLVIDFKYIFEQLEPFLPREDR